MSEKRIQELKAALTGINLSETWPPRDAQKILERSSPPSYLMRLVLEIAFGYRLPSVHDKSAWAIAIQYKGHLFEIADWKRSTWNVFGSPTDEHVVRNLERKLTAAAKKLDRHIKAICRDLLSAGDFSLDNQFHRYLNLFEQFRSECEENLGSLANEKRGEGLESRDPVRGLEATFKAMMDRSMKSQSNLLAAAIFFFSLSEVIFDACFALGERGGVSYTEFRRKLDWSERFKHVLPLSDKKVAEVYERLFSIRRLYRNIPVHASPVYGFHIERVGLVPATYDDLDNPNLRWLWLGDDVEAESILADLDRSIDFFASHPRTMFGFAYAESGLAIHIAEKRLDRYRAEMGSIESFRKFLERLVLQAEFERDLIS